MTRSSSEICRLENTRRLGHVEEGIFQHWHFGHIVLVGDAAHKVRQSHLSPSSEKKNDMLILSAVVHTKPCLGWNVRHRVGRVARKSPAGKVRLFGHFGQGGFVDVGEG